MSLISNNVGQPQVQRGLPIAKVVDNFSNNRLVMSNSNRLPIAVPIENAVELRMLEVVVPPCRPPAPSTLRARPVINRVGRDETPSCRRSLEEAAIQVSEHFRNALYYVARIGTTRGNIRVSVDEERLMGARDCEQINIRLQRSVIDRV